MVTFLIQKIMSCVDAMERRPWLPLLAYLCCYGLLWLVMGVMIANFLHSRWRILPELTNSNKVFLSRACDQIIVILLFVGIVSAIVIPVLLAMVRRFKAALQVFSLSLAGVLFSVGVTVILGPVFFVLGIEMDKAERAERAARERDWHNTFTFSSEFQANDPDRWWRYDLVDRVGEEGLCYDLYNLQSNALVKAGVVRWQKVDKQLCLMTKSKETSVLDFESGKLVDYSSSVRATNSVLESVFDRLKDGLDEPLRVDLDQIQLFASYAELEKWPNLPQIVPRAATDIMAYCAPVFQGELARARCRLTNDEFQKFAQSHGYEFKAHDLCLSPSHGACRTDGDPVFSHFPLGWCGQVIGHHADGFSICEASRPNYKSDAKESLVYLYDSKCGMLWIEYSR